MVSITQLLRDDHKRLKGLLRQLEVAGLRLPETKASIIRETVTELEVLARIEEDVVYPALLEVLTDTRRLLVSDGYSAHAEIAAMLEEIKAYEKEGALDTPQ